MTVKILYVEDNRMNFVLVKKILSSYDVEVLHAEDGPRAVVIAEEQKPALVLLDLQLPGMDGFQVAGRIRTIESLSDVPILAVTASVMARDRQEAERTGLDGYLEKPLDIKAFLEEIGRLLGDRLVPRRG